MTAARLMAIGALLAIGACDDDTGAGVADLAAPADQAGVRDLAFAVGDGGLPASCTTTAGADACDPATQYCSQTLAGAPPRGAPWTNGSEGCVALPAACASTPTCSCVLANGAQPGCSCTMVDAQVLVTCVRP